MEERRVSTTGTEVLEEITETARSILASLQNEGLEGPRLSTRPWVRKWTIRCWRPWW